MTRMLLVVAAVAAFFPATPAAFAAPLQATFLQRSYRPGDVALLRIVSTPSRVLQLDVFRVGARLDAGDRTTEGAPVDATRRLDGPPSPWTLHLPIGDWPSGVYVARLVAADGDVTYAPFVLRPRLLGHSARVLVVEPTNTWQAYNDYGGDSWYESPFVHVIALDRPYEAHGLPGNDALGVGFLRWYAASGATADFVADDDLERFADAAQLRRLYDLIVFPGHEEYVTVHVYDLVEGFRNLGGSLAFLAANNFFYRVAREGDAIVGRTRWRDLGRPEAALVGAQYVGWDEQRFPNVPYRVASVAAAPWFFAGSGLHYGSTFGRYGIEIDALAPSSPHDTRVLASIPNDFGPGVAAEMTYYRRGRAQVFDAGVMNFGASADWPVVSTLMDNLWQHLSGERAPLGRVRPTSRTSRRSA